MRRMTRIALLTLPGPWRWRPHPRPPGGRSRGTTSASSATPTERSSRASEQLFHDGVTGGCGGGNYCPTAPVTRAQMAVFLSKARHPAGCAYLSTGTMFADVAAGYWAGGFIEQLAREGLTGGCGGGLYCPEAAVRRDQMAAFLVKGFRLP